MFDTLVESMKRKPGNARKLFLATSLVYVLVLTTAAAASILWLNPQLVDAFEVTSMIAPPPPPSAPPPVSKTPAASNKKHTPEPTTFTPPTRPPQRIPDPTTVTSRPVVVAQTGIPNGVPYGQPNGLPNGADTSTNNAPPPPPPPAPKPTPEATPKPEPPKQIKISGGVLQGNALNKVQPPYPAIAKAARAAGAVQIQVTISEEGSVIEASVVSGHPLLREAALQAAKQWKFKPTELTGVPVKVQGILTFNFTLQ